MTAAEAKERLLHSKMPNDAEQREYDLAVLHALDKQIPKKPLHMHKNYYCPICKEDGWMLWDDAIPNDVDKYCIKCGQAIDWEK